MSRLVALYDGPVLIFLFGEGTIGSKGCGTFGSDKVVGIKTSRPSRGVGWHGFCFTGRVGTSASTPTSMADDDTHEPITTPKGS